MDKSTKTEIGLRRDNFRCQEFAFMKQTIRPGAIFLLVLFQCSCTNNRGSMVATQVLSSVSVPTRPGSISLMCRTADGIVIGTERTLVGYSQYGAMTWSRPIRERPVHLAATISGKTVAVATSEQEILVGDAVSTNTPLRSLISCKPDVVQAIAWVDEKNW